MTLQRLRTFLCVAKHRNLTDAARELRTTQPSVSRHLKTLEREYGVTLYRIVKSGIALTEHGEKFLHDVQALIVRFDEFKTSFTESSQRNAPHLRIGGSFGAVANLLPSAIAKFRVAYPRIKILANTAASPELEQQLLDSKIDLALLTRPRYLPSLVYEPCGREKVVAVVCKSHPFAKKGKLYPNDLGRVPLLIRSRLNGNVSRVEARLREFQRDDTVPEIAMSCDSHSTLVASIRNGAGVGFIRRECLPHNLKKENLQILKTPWLRLFYDSYAVYPKERPMTAAARDFLTLLRKRAKPLSAPPEREHSAV